MRYLSQYTLAPSDVRALRLTDSYSLHRVVYDLFENVRGGDTRNASGILFADKGMRQGQRRVLILSDRPPYPACRGLLQTRELPESYLLSARYAFQIIINPVRRSNSTGKIIPLRDREAVAEWFCAKAPSWGFSVHAASLQVTDFSVDRFAKGDALVTLLKATLTGMLEVTDREAFAHSVVRGLGRAKAFGCGLLQIVPSC